MNSDHTMLIFFILQNDYKEVMLYHVNLIFNISQ